MDFSVKHPMQILKTFKEILNEAADLYEKPKSKITEDEFMATSGGRLGRNSMLKCGGYIKLRNYTAPGKKDISTINFFQKVLARAK